MIKAQLSAAYASLLTGEGAVQQGLRDLDVIVYLSSLNVQFHWAF
jgi:hypothetical protein